jgi:hypothetical protein
VTVETDELSMTEIEQQHGRKTDGDDHETEGAEGETGEELTSGLLAKGSARRRVKTPGKEMAAVVTVADA